mmetsp:Transcript_67201/g.119648  ORF Transcript_67201/g.119648 Transcript_67201/m.119648 type:complete len:557 (+) Transcript_67201:194-1864(+)
MNGTACMVDYSGILGGFEMEVEAQFNDLSWHPVSVIDTREDSSTGSSVLIRWEGGLAESETEWVGLERLRSRLLVPDADTPTKNADPEPESEHSHPKGRMLPPPPPGPPPSPAPPGPPPGTPPDLPGVASIAFDSGLSSLEKGMKLHAQDEHGNWFLAEVVEVNLKPNVEAPVKVHYMGHQEERWVSVDRLRSKVLRTAGRSFDKDVEAELEDTSIAEPVGQQKPIDLSGLDKGLRLQAQADDGIWYVAEVVTVSNMKKRVKAPVLVHYIGHDHEFDEWVGTERLRSKALKGAASKAVTLGPQGKADAEWEEAAADLPDLSGLEKGLRLQAKGEDDIWYVAEVVQVATDSAHAEAPVLVHYMGHGRRHDEWISLDRIRSKALQGVPKVDTEPEKNVGIELGPDLSGLDVGLRLQAKGGDGVWYVAEVKSLSTSKKHAKAPVLVHYIGHGSESDEWLGPERLRSKALKGGSSRPEGDVERASASRGRDSFSSEPGEALAAGLLVADSELGTASAELDGVDEAISAQVWNPVTETTEDEPAPFTEEQLISEKKVFQFQ